MFPSHDLGGRHLFPWRIVESGEVLTYEKLRPIVLNFCIEIVKQDKLFI